MQPLLINLFGYWINPQHVIRLYEDGKDTIVYMAFGYGFNLKGKTADQVVNEINSQWIVPPAERPINVTKWGPTCSQ